MDYQQMTLFGEQDTKQSRSYQGGSLASRTALQESVKRLLMSVICGQSTGELLAKFDHNGLLLKMYGGCYQVKMDGSFEEYSEILPTWGLMLDGAVIAPPMLERFIPERGLELLPTVVASEIFAGRMKSTQQKPGSKHSMMLTDVLRLLPTPQCSDYKGVSTKRYRGSKDAHYTRTAEALRNGKDDPCYLNPNYAELLMGFGGGWTELKH